MSYNVKKHLTTVNKGDKGSNKPEWIIAHFVGAFGQALGNARYFRNTYRGASAHYFVDPKDIYQVVEDDRSAWHIGDGSRTRKGKHNGYVTRGGATNTNSIGVEMCLDPKSSNSVWTAETHKETVNKTEWLIKQLQEEYGIPDSRVIRHFDATTKLCPGNWKHNNWAKWWEFKKRLAGTEDSSEPTGNEASEGKHADEHMHLVETGETLYGIAKDHGVTVEQMVEWNDLEDKNLIIPETKLFVKDPSVDYNPQSDIEQLAKDVIDGKYGSGDARKDALGSQYDAVQDMVNQMLLGKVSSNTTSKAPSKTITQLAKEVIDGQHGSGDARKRSLGSKYDEVQRRVNELLGSRPSSKSISQLADEVIDGKHGTGRERMISLGSNYAAVQKEVNRRFK